MALCSAWFIALAGLVIGQTVRSEDLDREVTAIPVPGDVASKSGENLQQDVIRSPIPDAMSLQELGNLIAALAADAKMGMRGAQEIAVYRQAAPAVVLLKTKEGSGSGIVLQNGLIATNRHVVQGVGGVQIFFKPNDIPEGRQTMESRLGTVVAVDPTRDLALIRAESLPPNYRFLKISSENNFDVGTDVYAIGARAR
jgi:S1-C subfamily serine protease